MREEVIKEIIFSYSEALAFIDVLEKLKNALNNELYINLDRDDKQLLDEIVSYIMDNATSTVHGIQKDRVKDIYDEGLKAGRLDSFMNDAALHLRMTSKYETIFNNVISVMNDYKTRSTDEILLAALTFCYNEVVFYKDMFRSMNLICKNSNSSANIYRYVDEDAFVETKKEAESYSKELSNIIKKTN